MSGYCSSGAGSEWRFRDEDFWGEGGCTSLQQLHGLRPLSFAQLAEKKRRGEKIVMVTAYDLFTARVADDALVDMLLVGDSVANVVMGESRTTAVDLDTMIFFAKLVAKGARRAIPVFDMPYGSYNSSAEAVAAVTRVVRETGIRIVKMEGHIPEVVKEVKKHALVCGHIGVMPQTASSFSSRGRTASSAESLLKEALDLENAGADLIVLEMVCSEVAQLISQRLRIPTIGIGSGRGCDGQVLVIHDVLGMGGPCVKQLKLAKRYASLYNEAVQGVSAFRQEVQAGVFPEEGNAFRMKEGEFELFAKAATNPSSQVESLQVLPLSPAPEGDSSDSVSASPLPLRKICIRGAGRMGQLFAWLLAGGRLSDDASKGNVEVSAEVVLVTRRADLHAMLQGTPRQGLVRLAKEEEEKKEEENEDSRHFEARGLRVMSPEQVADSGERFDLFLIACSSNDTSEAAEMAFACTRPGGTVASLQNGLKAPRLLRSLYDQLVSRNTKKAPSKSNTKDNASSDSEPPALVFLSVFCGAEELVPLKLVLRGNLRVRLCGHSLRSAASAEILSQFLRSADAETECVAPFMLDAVLWRKAAVNAYINSLSAILDCPNGDLADEKMEGIRHRVLAEVVSVARAKGLSLSLLEVSLAAKETALSTAMNLSSTLNHIRQGRATEIADICGEVWREGKLVGVPTPVNKVLFDIVDIIAMRRRTR